MAELTYQEAMLRYPHAPGDPDVHDALFREIARLNIKLATIRLTWESYPVRMMQQVLDG